MQGEHMAAHFRALTLRRYEATSRCWYKIADLRGVGQLQKHTNQTFRMKTKRILGGKWQPMDTPVRFLDSGGEMLKDIHNNFIVATKLLLSTTSVVVGVQALRFDALIAECDVRCGRGKLNFHTDVRLQLLRTKTLKQCNETSMPLFSCPFQRRQTVSLS